MSECYLRQPSTVPAERIWTRKANGPIPCNSFINEPAKILFYRTPVLDHLQTFGDEESSEFGLLDPSPSNMALSLFSFSTTGSQKNVVSQWMPRKVSASVHFPKPTCVAYSTLLRNVSISSM